MNNYTKENLKSLGIYELRTVARELGVYSPTTLKKNEIIEKIMDIVTGVTKPHVRTTKQGRPAKNISKITEVVNLLSKNNLNEVPYALRMSNNFSNNSFRSPLSYTNCDEKDFSGLLGQENGEYIVKFDFKKYLEFPVIIPKSYVCQLGLKIGDFIRGKTGIKDNKVIATQIDSVNSVCTNNKIIRPNFSDIKYEFPDSHINLESLNPKLINLKVIDKVCPVYLGARILINYENNKRCDLSNVEYVFDLTKQNIGVNLIGANFLPENLENIKTNYDKVKIITNSYVDHTHSFYNELEIKFENILRNVENGKDEVVIIEDYDSIIKKLSNEKILNDNFSPLQAEIFANNIILKIFSCAKLTNQGSLTVILFNSNNEDIVSLANVKIFINEIPYENSDVTIDIKKSNSLNAEKFVSDKDYKKLEDFKIKINKCPISDFLTLLNELF